MQAEQISKVKTYIGFSIKSGKIVWGYDNITAKPKNLKLVLVCSLVAEKHITKLMARMENFNIEVLQLKTNITLDQVTDRENIKFVGFTDRNLSLAILENSELFNNLKRGN